MPDCGERCKLGARRLRGGGLRSEPHSYGRERPQAPALRGAALGWGAAAALKFVSSTIYNGCTLQLGGANLPPTQNKG